MNIHLTIAPQIKGLRIEVFITFLTDKGLADYLSTKTKKGNWPKLARTWLVVVSKKKRFKKLTYD